MNCGLAALSPLTMPTPSSDAPDINEYDFGDARPGDTFMHSLGHPINYNNLCHAENEEDSAFEPYHVEKVSNRKKAQLLYLEAGITTDKFSRPKLAEALKDNLHGQGRHLYYGPACFCSP